MLIVAFSVFARWLVRLERENALPRIVVRDLESGEEHAVAFEEEAYSLGLAGSYEFDTDILRFTYSSMTTPEHVYDYDMRTRERTVRKVQEVPSGHDPADYVTRRIMAPSHDGEAVPGLAAAPAGHPDRRLRPPAPLRLRLVRDCRCRRRSAPRA